MFCFCLSAMNNFAEGDFFNESYQPIRFRQLIWDIKNKIETLVCIVFTANYK